MVARRDVPTTTPVTSWMRMSSCERSSAPTAPFMPSPTAVLLGLVLIASAAGCGPGKFGSRRRIPRKLTPLVFKQHVPNVPETSLAASGPFEGKITREDARFKELVPNYSNDIDFRDEEGDGQDRIMTPRCSEKLNTLAISVMNLYPGVRLRVSEGWDDEGYHSKDSLHFEGRAVDLTTSDRDRSKYGMLGRLAVEAGFDFVYYESRSHIHASCKSESAESGRFGGCFHGSSLVETPSGPKAMSQLSIGEEVLVVRSDGSFGFSQVILFLDRDEEQRRTYVHIETAGGASLTLTPEHVLFVQEDAGEATDAASAVATFAHGVEAGDRIYRKGADSQLLLDSVVNVTLTFGVGVYAPLTYEGNIVVNDIVASVYAVLSDQTLAHWAFFPVRVGDNFRQAAYHFWRELRLVRTPNSNNRTVTPPQKGVHWYPSLLYSAYSYALQFL